jgi:hypothetical protein
MRSFLLKLGAFYALTFCILFVLKRIQDMPRERLIAKGMEKNHLKWSGFRGKKEANTLFFGSSRIYSSIHPEIFDSLAGTRSYNMGTGSQSIEETYYYIKEAVESNRNIKWIVVDLFERSFNLTDYMHLSQNARYLSPGNRWGLFYQSGFARNLMNTAFPLLADVGYLNIDIRGSFKSNLDSAALKGNRLWVDGFNISEAFDTAELKTMDVRNKTMQSRRVVKIKKDRLRMVERIVRLCDEYGINVTFTCLPKSNVVDKDEVEFFENVVRASGNAGFFSEYPKLTNLDFRSDGFHMNNSGAEKCTIALVSHMIPIIRDSTVGGESGR